ncbi:hypothetical protein SELMODRAFT_430531 [Selaginella moellendorffii]|uniref:Uncharacterized protein n=1 Tax=Selaginella moellendorffii TaxID=88036 RepID=D8T9P6_SELML|nr:hypothetical protein SELMODRAFT_430531 [Selaginella moellendorffii]
MKDCMIWLLESLEHCEVLFHLNEEKFYHQVKDDRSLLDPIVLVRGMADSQFWLSMDNYLLPTWPFLYASAHQMDDLVKLFKPMAQPLETLTSWHFCNARDPEHLEILLKLPHMDPNRTSPEGSLPLIAALYRLELENVKLRIAAGADPTLPTYDGILCPLARAAYSNEDDQILRTMAAISTWTQGIFSGGPACLGRLECVESYFSARSLPLVQHAHAGLPAIHRRVQQRGAGRTGTSTQEPAKATKIVKTAQQGRGKFASKSYEIGKALLLLEDRAHLKEQLDQ